MSNKEERFVLYEYLLYFWKKKWAFLIIPIITIVLALAVNALWPKDGNYTGQSTIYVGSVKAKEVIDPPVIEHKYKNKEELKNTFEVYVPQNGYLRVKIKGNNSDTIESDLTHLTTWIVDDLKENHAFRYGTTKLSKENSERTLQMLEEDIDSLKAKINKDSLNETDIEYLTAMLNFKRELSDTQSSINSKANDLALLEEPVALDSTVDPTKTYTLESALIGLLLGLILTVALLTLLKYIEEAKRYYNSK